MSSAQIYIMRSIREYTFNVKNITLNIISITFCFSLIYGSAEVGYNIQTYRNPNNVPTTEKVTLTTPTPPPMTTIRSTISPITTESTNKSTTIKTTTKSTLSTTTAIPTTTLISTISTESINTKGVLYIIYGEEGILTLVYNGYEEDLEYFNKVGFESYNIYNKVIYFKSYKSYQNVYDIERRLDISYYNRNNRIQYTHWGFCWDNTMLMINKDQTYLINYSKDFGINVKVENTDFFPFSSWLFYDFLVEYYTCNTYIATDTGLFISEDRGLNYIQITIEPIIKLYRVNHVMIFNVFRNDIVSYKGFGSYYYHYNSTYNYNYALTANNYTSISYIDCTVDHKNQIVICLVKDKNNAEMIVPIKRYSSSETEFERWNITGKSVKDTNGQFTKIQMLNDPFKTILILYNEGQQNKYVIREGEQTITNIQVVQKTRKYKGFIPL